MRSQAVRNEKPARGTTYIEHAHAVLHRTGDVPWYRRILPFLGPAFIAAVAYIDPGNFATNIQAGAKYGYLLIWVIIASNLMAILIQTLSAKLGIATGNNLAEVSRDHMPDWLRWSMWIISELVAIATDIAEFIGAALGLNLLTGVPMFPATVIIGLATLLLLKLQERGIRPLEAVIVVMLGIVAFCYLIQMVLERPAWGEVGQAVIMPRFRGPDSVMLAAGILGATVMPHVIYLHSALTQNRIEAKTPEQERRLFRFEMIDIGIAMVIAGAVNAAMLIMAAAVFFRSGLSEIASIEEAHRTLEPLVGPAASALFGISLLVAGLASTTVGTMAGQTVMQGFMHFHIPLWVRRVVTMLPSLVIVAMALDTTSVLVLSQVILSFGIPFALVPLVIFTARRDIMGPTLVNRKVTTLLAWGVSGLIIALNLFLLWETFA